MRLLAVLVVAIILTVARGTPSAASCAPPVPLADRGALAVAVIHGTVASVGGGALTLRVDRVFKGVAATPLRVFVGPARGVGATSVDYTAASGTDQMLYLITGLDGELETNACIGNHSGPATAEELAYFGAGVAPTAGSLEILVQLTGNHPPSVADFAAWAGLALVLIGAGAVIVARRRKTGEGVP
jgi:hypothetical protein